MKEKRTLGSEHRPSTSAGLIMPRTRSWTGPGATTIFFSGAGELRAASVWGHSAQAQQRATRRFFNWPLGRPAGGPPAPATAPASPFVRVRFPSPSRPGPPAGPMGTFSRPSASCGAAGWPSSIPFHSLAACPRFRPRPEFPPCRRQIFCSRPLRHRAAGEQRTEAGEEKNYWKRCCTA